jgi:hypothetical protein
MIEIQLQQLNLLSDGSSAISRYFQILKQECQRETHRINHLLDLEWFETEMTNGSSSEDCDGDGI